MNQAYANEAKINQLGSKMEKNKIKIVGKIFLPIQTKIKTIKKIKENRIEKEEN